MYSKDVLDQGQFYREESAQYLSLLPEDKFKVNEIVEQAYNRFRERLEIINSEVVALIEDLLETYNMSVYEEDQDDVEDVYEDENEWEIIPAIINRVSNDFQSYMSPANKEHGIYYTSSASDKASKLAERIEWIIRRANGEGVEESSDPDSIIDTCDSWTREFYEITSQKDTGEYDLYDMRQWFLDTKIFTEEELAEELA